MFSSNSNSQSSQGFKKKNINTSSDVNSAKSNNKLGDLKSKLEKEKEMMRKTGRRFKEDSTSTIDKQEISIINTNESGTSGGSNKHEVCIGPDEPVKQKISLKEIGIDNNSTNSSMQSSRIFEKEFLQQKKRSDELVSFLKSIQMEQFAELLIQNGFDDLDTLAEITTDDLNSVMMRAPLQDKLIHELKVRKLRTEVDKKIESNEDFGSTSSVWRTKTHSENPKSYPNRPESAQIISKLKKEQNPTTLSSGSFLYSIGSKNWSTEDQVRRACSVCFKVEQQMNKKGECFYCGNCWKYVSEDVLNVELNINFDRSYKKTIRE